MKTEQLVVRQLDDLSGKLERLAGLNPQWVLVFASARFFADPRLYENLHAAFPAAILSGCSTAGEIDAQGVDEGSCVITAVHFDQVRLSVAVTQLQGMNDSLAAGQRLGEQLRRPDLKALMVFGPGLQINGSALVDGLASVLGESLPLTGGLAGDDGAFQETWTLGPDGVGTQQIVAIAFKGENLRFGHGSFGGWEAFGPARRVTHCEGNILYELDGAPALDVYKRYLGDYARDLPASGLLFPLAMLGSNHDQTGLIRTILGVSEVDGSLILAGEIIPDGYLKLMHASTDRLVAGAESAAALTRDMLGGHLGDGLALLVSCVGRKLVMGARVDEEVESVAALFGESVRLSGFYSYGEISPIGQAQSCKLHNQTMTITYLGEQ